MSSIVALAPSTNIDFPDLKLLCKKETVSVTHGLISSAYFWKKKLQKIIDNKLLKMHNV